MRGGKTKVIVIAIIIACIAGLILMITNPEMQQSFTSWFESKM